MEDKSSINQGPHKLLIQGRKSVELTGVREVVSFDAKEVILNTTMGALVIRGSDFFVRRLTVEKGEVELEGQIDSFIYTGKPGRTGENGSLLKRLFR